jgi:hypothetical protein
MTQDRLEHKMDATLAAIRKALDSSEADEMRCAESGPLPSCKTTATKLPSEGTHASAAQGLQPLEGTVSELLGPVLQMWLLENLNELVRRLVQEELRKAEATTDHESGRAVLPEPAPPHSPGKYPREGGLIRAMLLNRRLANGIAGDKQEVRHDGGARPRV